MAFITVDDILPYLSSDNYQLSDNDLTLLQDIINSVCLFVEDYTGRYFEQKSVTEILDGSGSHILYLNHLPIVQLDGIWIDVNHIFDDTTEQDVNDFYVSNNGMLLWRCGIFPFVEQSVKVSYIAGYSSVPSDVKNVCCHMVAIQFRKIRKKETGLRYLSANRENVVFIDPKPLLPEHEAILNRYCVLKV